MHNGTVGHRMRTARKRAGISMERVGKLLAEAINRPEGPFSAQAVQQWEVGATDPTIDTIRAFVAIPGLLQEDRDITWLITGVRIHPVGEDQATEPPAKGRVVA